MLFYEEREVHMLRSKMPLLVAQKEAKERRRITQQEIADSTGLRRATISAWINWGEFKRLDADVIIALCNYFQCSLEDLVEIDPSSTSVADDAEGQAVAVAAL